MNTNIFDFAQYNSSRKKLGEVLPLEMPFTIQIFINEICNFRCSYCIKSYPIQEQKKNKIFSRSMSYLEYKNIIDKIAEAGKIKLLLLQGWGEPLLHRDIDKMVQYAKQKEAAEIVRIITNASLLTKEMSDKLINVELDSLKISLQGLNAKDYKETSDVIIDFDSIKKNIAYFYTKKKNTKVIIKIMEHMIEDKEEFYKEFSEICDEIIVESLVPIIQSEKGEKNKKESSTFWNEELANTDICSIPFMRAHIDVNGEVLPCCHIPYPCSFGNIAEGFQRVWNGENHLNFLIQFLQGNRKQMPICEKCNLFIRGIVPQDILDNYREELLEKYKNIKEREY